MCVIEHLWQSHGLCKEHLCQPKAPGVRREAWIIQLFPFPCHSHCSELLISLEFSEIPIYIYMYTCLYLCMCVHVWWRWGQVLAGATEAVCQSVEWQWFCSNLIKPALERTTNQCFIKGNKAGHPTATKVFSNLRGIFYAGIISSSGWLNVKILKLYFNENICF